MQNPYLSGNFAPVHEELTGTTLPVLGALPADLHGNFVRNGPNPQFAPKGLYHWFDGDGMLHGVQLSGGRASYRNRYVKTRGYEVERAAGRAVWGSLLELPDFENPDGPFKNAANTALVWHQRRLLALWEGGPPHEVTLPALETLGPYDFGGALSIPMTAHPKVDPVTGELVFFGYSLVAEPYVTHGLVSKEGALVRTVPIDLPGGVMMHDFAVTERYSLILDLPLTFQLGRAMEGQYPFVFQREQPSRFGLLPRHATRGDEIRWFTLPACYIWHTLNAYEEGDEVVLLGGRVSETDVLPPSLRGEAPRDEEPATLFRWRFNLANGTAKEEQLDDIPIEFTRVNDAYLGRKNRYGYAGRIAAGREAASFSGAVKFDLATQRTQVYELPPGHFCGEWVFAPRPHASAEDDGYLLSYVHDERENRSWLYILEAQQPSAGPVARVALPGRVPYGFHGAWIPA